MCSMQQGFALNQWNPRTITSTPHCHNHMSDCLKIVSSKTKFSSFLLKLLGPPNPNISFFESFLHRWLVTSIHRFAPLKMENAHLHFWEQIPAPKIAHAQKLLPLATLMIITSKNLNPTLTQVLSSYGERISRL